MELPIENPNRKRIQEFFHTDWAEKLIQKGVFSAADPNRIVDEGNIKKVIKAIGLKDLVTEAEAMEILKKYGKKEAKFEDFYLDLVKLMNKIAEDDFEDIMNDYNTPAERIVKILLTLKMKYLNEDPEMEKEINYAISKINLRQIYVTEQKDRGQRRVSAQPMRAEGNGEILEWLKEYSEINMLERANSSISAAKVSLQVREAASASDSMSSPYNRKSTI